MFLNAVYEADTLISAMENRANQYKDLREQLLVLKKTFKGISNSGDEFQGQGADSIKSFYQEQAALVDEWLTFIDMQIAFLRGVAAEAEELKLSGHTYVDMNFLESDLLNGYRRSKDLVSDQKQDLDNILRSIDDLVSLRSFQTDTFDTYIDKAEKERKTTIDKVNELTEKLTYEYQQSEAVQEHIRHRFEALNDATKRGGQASPIYFDAKAYHNSSAYKLKDSVQHQAKSYLSYKKEQAEKRKIEKLQKELETPNLSLDEYLKIAEDLGEENLTAEQREIVGLIKANKQQGEILKGVGAGLWDFTKDTATGLWNIIMMPPEKVLYDMGLAVINYDETYAQISEAIASSYERDMVNGNDFTRARWVTYAIATVGTSLVGTKGVEKVGKAGFAAGKNTVMNVKEAASNKLNKVNNTSSFTPGYGFAWGFEGVPYNVVDSLGLRDRLMAKAADTYKLFKGTGKYQVGAYKDIKGVEGLDAHHAGQKAAMKKLVDNYDLNTAPAINVPKVGHTIKGPNGIVSRSTKGIDNPRQLLARDIRELRRVYDDIPNSALKELIKLNKKMYPEMRK
ncbi:ribonuclease YeeF family protein [Metabacillus idriensis]|uniref:ribonuclease YeeF family protein n=1 Tax=Metabacillus idriensis TaxID=324768 RepID=UPI00174DA3BE|nr:T7SS effector LXG polymorphic toxin [Metabacillus idriensis]